MATNNELDKIKNYFNEKLQEHGANFKGVDYNSVEAQEARFYQLTGVIKENKPYSLLDFGSGYGAIYDYLTKLGHNVRYFGYDISQPMIQKGRDMHKNQNGCLFSDTLEGIPVLDYAMASGTFNMKLDTNNETWTDIVVEALNAMNARALRGLSFNMLTIYSDADRMRPDLYYADPCFFFDYCKKHFSRNVALLHDYQLYDFTIIVRKD